MINIMWILLAHGDAGLHTTDALQGSRSAHKTLRAWQKDIQVKANYWERCRLQRVADYEDLQVGSVHSLKLQHSWQAAAVASLVISNLMVSCIKVG